MKRKSWSWASVVVGLFCLPSVAAEDKPVTLHEHIEYLGKLLKKSGFTYRGEDERGPYVHRRWPAQVALTTGQCWYTAYTRRESREGADVFVHETVTGFRLAELDPTSVKVGANHELDDGPGSVYYDVSASTTADADLKISNTSRRRRWIDGKLVEDETTRRATSDWGSSYASRDLADQVAKILARTIVLAQLDQQQ